jgi:3',5'-cyclic AMP phosphodiesterase CpdA
VLVGSSLRPPPPPTLVVPGNHDVFPWWRLISRLFDPLRRYEKIITPDLAPHVELPGVVVQGINSAYGWTIKGGKITDTELNHIRRGFQDAPDDAFRILVVHHHLAELEQLGGHDISKGAHEALAVAHECRVNMILCGHLHIPHITHVSIHKEGVQPILVVSAGTSTSSRGRGEHATENYFNIIELYDSECHIMERRFKTDTNEFEMYTEKQFTFAP